MKKWLVVYFTIGLASSASAAEVVKIGFHGLKPHSFAAKDTGTATGAAVQVTNELLAEAGYTVKWVGPIPFPRLLEMLKEGSLDAALPMTRRPDREEFAYFTDKPLMMTTPAFTVLITNPLKTIESIADVKGYRVGYLSGADQTGFLKDNASSLTIELLPAESWITQCLNKLFAGRLDAIYDLNAWSIPYEAKLAGVADKIKVLKVPGTPGALYILISKKVPRSDLLHQKLNAALNKKRFNYQDYIDKVSE